jgi:histidinol-phosphate aminotransferase
MKLAVSEAILSIAPYVPGKPIETLEREYGIRDAIKLASNENPLGPSPLAVKAIEATLGKLHRYPDGAGHDLTNELAAFLGLAPENIVLGNGSDDIIGMLTRAFLRPGDEVIIPQPSFLMYDIGTRSADACPVPVPLHDLAIDLEGMLQRVTDRTRMIFLTNPHNPTGAIISQKAFEAFWNTVPAQVVVVLDEAYIEFARDNACLKSVPLLDEGRPLVILRTFSKLYGLAGLRMGYGIMPRQIADLLNRIRQPFTTSTLAQIGARAALRDSAFVKQTLELVHTELEMLYKALERMGVRFFPTQANFFMIDVERSADQVFEALLQRGVIVRAMTSYGYPQFIRVSVGLPAENVRFIEALKMVL